MGIAAAMVSLAITGVIGSLEVCCRRTMGVLRDGRYMTGSSAATDFKNSGVTYFVRSSGGIKGLFRNHCGQAPHGSRRSRALILGSAWAARIAIVAPDPMPNMPT